MVWGWKAAAGRLGITYEEYARHREAGDYWCASCKSWRPISEFYLHADGTPHQRECKPCKRARCEAFKAAYLEEHGVEYVRTTSSPTR
jgi:hypothetical protein